MTKGNQMKIHDIDSAPLKKGCMRSHPHENMNDECQRKTDQARESRGIEKKQEITDVFIRGVFGIGDRGLPTAKDQQIISAARHLLNVDRKQRNRDANEDTERLDWLDRNAHCADWESEQPIKRVIRACDGEYFFGTTWREAIDAALGQQEIDNDRSRK